MYDLSGVWMNGEHLIVDDAQLSTQGGLPAANWSVVLQGAHMLYQPVNERVALKMATGDGHEVSGEARVAESGNRDTATKIFDGVKLEGVTALRPER